MIKTILIVLIGVFLYPDTVFAGSIEYDFSFMPTSGPFQPFSFVIVSPTFLDQEPLSFTPFSYTDGTNTWTMAQGSTADLYNPGDIQNQATCFEFATATAGSVSPCSSEAQEPNGGDILMSFGYIASFPMGIGTYSHTGIVAGIMGPLLESSPGTVTLTVSEVPEPRTTLALGLALGALLAAWIRTHQ